MPEQTEVERLQEEAAKIKADLAAAVRLADQRENLLPKLEKRLERFYEKRAPIQDEIELLLSAVQSIRSGTPTTYQFRKPRAKRPAEGAE